VFHICEQKYLKLFFEKCPFLALQNRVAVIIYMLDIVLSMQGCFFITAVLIFKHYIVKRLVIATLNRIELRRRN